MINNDKRQGSRWLMSKAIFFDIDGTLIDSINGKKEISQSVREAIYRLQAKGHYVFIATGRPYAFLSDYIKEFGFDGYVVANGAQIILNDQTIFKAKMDPEVIKELVNDFEKHNIQYILESDRYSYLKKEYEEFTNFYRGFDIIPHPLIKQEYELEDVEVLKVEMLCPDEETVATCLELLSRYPEYGYFSSVTSRIFELYQKKYTKGSAVLRLLEYLEIPLDDSYAFGDGSNDTEMLQSVGCGIAMGNASDQVKQFAKVVTASVQEDGVATGIERYIL